MRIGIFFGGKSREREISFAGGRTVYDLLDKSLFTPVPLFVDSLGNIILLDWQYLYKGSIRDFYPPVKSLSHDQYGFQIYAESLNPDLEKQAELISGIGKAVSPQELKSLIDFAFLALHGSFGEDGTIQGMLDFYEIPYSGSGILPSAIGIDKRVQKDLMEKMNVLAARSFSIFRENWINNTAAKAAFYHKAQAEFQLPIVIKSSTQGSSIGVSILKQWDEAEFYKIIDQSFFIRTITRHEWEVLDHEAKIFFTQQLCDIYEGTGVPFLTESKEILYHHSDVYEFLLSSFEEGAESIRFESLQSEPAVLIEEFIEGKEFSCIVVEGEHGEAIALPPTEIIKSGSIFDYRAKYLPGIARKVTPINLPEDVVNHISASCETLYKLLHFDVYARIDGLVKADGSIYLNDPNTTSGMLPSSFFFHQAAEIGLSPSQFLTFIIHKSLQKRRATSHQYFKLSKSIDALDIALDRKQSADTGKMTVAVILGGYSTERHISVESGRNIYEKLSSSGKYNTIPVFLGNHADEMDFYTLPLNLLLKDNADDIAEKCRHYHSSPIIDKIIEKAAYITWRFSSANYEFKPKKLSLDEIAIMADFVFIGLHGRPGEDGTLQKLLQEKGIPYNGSGTASSATTIDKYLTNEILRSNGFLIPDHYLVKKEAWIHDKEALLLDIEKNISYPLIAKPSDDGCSSAVKKIRNRQELTFFTEAMFRNTEELDTTLRNKLELKHSEEFPFKNYFVVEELINANGADHFLEVTGGMLSSYDEKGAIQYEIFEPSEALAQKGILSLEEKFLAGEGQNITPARFSTDENGNKSISEQVRSTLEKAAYLLNIEGYARIDAFVRIFPGNKTETIFIEVNSLPGLTPATCIFHQAAINGYKPFEFLDHIIQYGIAKNQKHEYHSAT